MNIKNILFRLWFIKNDIEIIKQFTYLVENKWKTISLKSNNSEWLIESINKNG